MENLKTIRADYEREYHQTAEELLQLKLKVETMIENLFIDGFTTDTKREMVEIMRKCR